MNWATPSDFFAMGGYAVYVWGSVAACVVAVTAELLGLRNRRLAIKRVLQRSALSRPQAVQECPV